MLNLQSHVTFCVMTSVREQQLEWVNACLDKTGMTVNALAEAAGMSPPNLYRFLDPSSKKNLEEARSSLCPAPPECRRQTPN